MAKRPALGGWHRAPTRASSSSSSSSGTGESDFPSLSLPRATPFVLPASPASRAGTPRRGLRCSPATHPPGPCKLRGAADPGSAQEGREGKVSLLASSPPTLGAALPSSRRPPAAGAPLLHPHCGGRGRGRECRRGMDRQGVCTLGRAGSSLQPSGEPGKGLSARPRSLCSAPLRATPRRPARPRALAPARADTYAHPRVKGGLRGPQGVVIGDIGCVQILRSLGEPLASSGLCCAPLPSPTSPGPPHQTELTPCPSRCVCSCVFRSSHVCDSHAYFCPQSGHRYILRDGR